VPGDEGVHERERAFYREEAQALDPERMPPGELHPFDRATIDRAGDVRGLRVLEVGCGSGDVTLELLARGADVTALDLSEDLLAVARARAERFRPGERAAFVAAPLEGTGLPDGGFDAIVGKWILHHTDLARSVPEVARLLRPGGHAVFFENQDLNPVLRFARTRLMGLPGVVRVGTRDERPLGEADFETLRAAFDRVDLLYPNFYFLEALGRQVTRYRGAALLQRADAAIWRRVARLRRYSYHVLIDLRKRPAP
jgi:SAM-dependent methyltransferase